LDLFELLLVFIGASLVLGLDAFHARGVSQVVCLVGSLHTEVLNHLDGASIEHVEVGPLVSREAPHSEAIDAGQAIHQLWTHPPQLLLTGSKAEVPPVRDHGERVCTPGHVLRCAPP